MKKLALPVAMLAVGLVLGALLVILLGPRGDQADAAAMADTPGAAAQDIDRTPAEILADLTRERREAPAADGTTADADAPDPTPERRARHEERVQLLLESAPSGRSWMVVDGHVTDRDGQPIEGATVQLERPVSHDPLNPASAYSQTVRDSTTTNRFGEFLMQSEGIAMMIVRASAEGYGEKTTDLSTTHRSDGRAHRQSVTLALEPAATLSGRVVTRSGEAVRNATVSILPTDAEARESYKALSLETGSDGAFSFESLAPGSWRIGAREGERYSALRDVSVPAEEVELTLVENNASIGGTVISKETGNPIAGVTIQATRNTWQFGGEERFQTGRRTASATSGAGGTFRFDNLAPGLYRILPQPSDDGFHPVQTRQQTQVSVREGQSVRDVEIVMTRGVTVVGTIVDTHTKEPVAGVNLEVRGQSTTGTFMAIQPPGQGRGAVVSDSSGQFRVDQVFGDALSVRMRDEGYLLARQGAVFGQPASTWPLGEGDPVEVTIEVERAVMLLGQVLDHEGNPAGNARVSIRASTPHFSESFRAEGGSVDENGLFRIKTIANRDIAFHVWTREGITQQFEDYNTGEEGLSDIELQLDPPAGVRGRVVDTEGRPVADAVVRVTHQGSRHSSPTDSAGRFQLVANEGESLSIYPAKEGWRARHRGVLVRPPDRMEEVELVMERGYGSIRGTVVDLEDEPIEGATVRLSQLGMEGRSNEVGSFAIDDVPAFETDVQVSKAEYESRSLSGISLDDDPIQIRLAPLQSITLVGLVVDGITEEPIESFRIQGSLQNIEYSDDVPGTFVGRANRRGSHTVSIQADGYPIHFEPVGFRDTDEEVVERTFRLQRNVTFNGRVVDKETGEPVAGMRMRANRQVTNPVPYSVGAHGRTASAQSDEEGLFTLAELIPGMWILAFEDHPPYVEKMATLDIAADHDPEDLREFQVERGHNVTLRFVRETDRTPIAGLAVEGQHLEGGPNVQTGADGSVLLTQAGANVSRRLLLPEHSLYVTVPTSSSAPDEPLDIVIGQAEIDVRVLSPNAPDPFQFTLQTAASAAAYRVTTEPIASVPPDSTGSWHRLTGLPSGSATVYASPVNPGDHGGHVGVRTVQVPREGRFEISLEHGTARLTGRVVDTNGRPITSASIRVTHASENYPISHLRTDSTGEYIQTSQPTGRVTIGLHDPRYEEASVEVEIAPGEARVTAPDLIARPTSHASIQVTARDLDTGALIPHPLQLRVTGENDYSRTERSANPSDQILVPTGEVRVVVLLYQSASHTAEEHRVTVRSGETTEIEAQLSRVARLDVRVRDSAGNPLGDVPVRLEVVEAHTQADTRESRTAENGTWHVSPLWPGTYRVEALNASGGVLAAENVTIPPGETGSATLVLP